MVKTAKFGDLDDLALAKCLREMFDRIHTPGALESLDYPERSSPEEDIDWLLQLLPPISASSGAGKAVPD
jgi:hypothetical protein